jgi:hypothetical protein
MAVTLAEALAGAWQSGPRMPRGAHWLTQPSSGRRAYPLMGRDDRTDSATQFLRATRASRLHSNRTTYLPRPAKSRQVIAKAWYLQQRSWQRSLPHRPCLLVVSWSHALPRNAQAAHACLLSLPECSCLLAQIDSSVHLCGFARRVRQLSVLSFSFGLQASRDGAFVLRNGSTLPKILPCSKTLWCLAVKRCPSTDATSSSSSRVRLAIRNLMPSFAGQEINPPRAKLLATRPPPAPVCPPANTISLGRHSPLFAWNLHFSAG